MSYVVSGASGKLGRQVAEALAKKVPVEELILVSRSPSKLSEWADRGAKVVTGDHRDIDILKHAYQGGSRLLIITSNNVGKRIAEHKNVIEAAKAVGIEHITYPSVTGAHPQNPTPSTADHVGTERLLWASGLSFTLIRNNLYMESLFDQIERAAVTGKWRTHGDKGHIAPISQVDIAACAAEIMCAPEKHDRVTYEISGPERLTFREISALAGDAFKRTIEYKHITADEMFARFERAGIPSEGDPSASDIGHLYGSNELVNQFVAYEQGYTDVLTAQVELITGRPPKTMADTIRKMIENKKP